MTTTPDAVEDVKNANILALLGDSITTDLRMSSTHLGQDGVTTKL